ncbi:MAG: AAA family ATPase [bacterium]|nr:AAA family ATPase [bacterium]
MERSLPLIPVATPLLPKCLEKVPLHTLAQDAMDSGVLTEGNYCILAYPKGGADLVEAKATMSHFHHIGVFAEVVQFEEKNNFEIVALIETHGRVFISDINHTEDGVLARCSPAQSIPLPKSQYKKATQVLDLFQERMAVSGQMEDEIISALTALDRPSDMADQIAAYLDLPASQRQQVLEEIDVSKRLDLVVHLLNENIINTSLSRNLDVVLEDKMNRERKEAVLRAKLRAIQMELHEEAGDEGKDYVRRLAELKMPEDTRNEIEKEIGKLRRLQAGSMEAGISQSYLDFALSLPWQQTNKKVKKADIKKVQKVLNQRHYGLNSVKERILEYLAVKRMAKESTSNILCLAGPPGVGKTSIVQSVAEALERPFYRISLGGVRDEADLRGHRRTYVGALPGKIIAAIHKSQVNSPVILLDEIDKMASGFRGDPASVLLEVLDPEQNHSFMDHFLQIPYNLSNVLFICTANNLPDIPEPLLNRLELIRINGYSTAEKVELATKYLLPKLIREYGMENLKLTYTAANMETLITGIPLMWA